jgi:purine-cytosine permease-like protein
VSTITFTKNNFGLFTTFFRYEKCAWAPSFIVFVVATGVGAKHFVDTPAAASATAAQYFSFGATIAGYTMAWATLSSDYTAYFHPRVSRFVEFRGDPHQI